MAHVCSVPQTADYAQHCCRAATDAQQTDAPMPQIACRQPTSAAIADRHWRICTVAVRHHAGGRRASDQQAAQLADRPPGQTARVPPMRACAWWRGLKHTTQLDPGTSKFSHKSPATETRAARRSQPADMKIARVRHADRDSHADPAVVGQLRGAQISPRLRHVGKPDLGHQDYPARNFACLSKRDLAGCRPSSRQRAEAAS